MEQQDPRTFRCAVISNESESVLPSRKMIPDHKLYFADMGSKNEAHYVCAYLNSHPVRTWLGGFLHGKQIGTSVFQFMYVPRFNPDEPSHRRLQEISKEAHRERSGERMNNPLGISIEDELTTLVRRIASRRAAESSSIR